MNNTNLIELMAQTKNYEKHRQKITKIMTKNSNATQTFDNRRIKVVNTYNSNRDRANTFNSKSKQEAIEKDNDLILKKIIQVNNRRNQSMKTNFSSTTRNYSHNNLNNLKKSLQTINNENQKLAQKLVTTNSNLSQQKMSDSYQKHLERKERLKKYEYDPEFGMVIPKKIKSLQKIKTLDPLRYDDSIASRYGGTSRYIRDNQQN